MQAVAAAEDRLEQVAAGAAAGRELEAAVAQLQQQVATRQAELASLQTQLLAVQQTADAAADAQADAAAAGSRRPQQQQQQQQLVLSAAVAAKAVELEQVQLHLAQQVEEVCLLSCGFVRYMLHANGMPGTNQTLRCLRIWDVSCCC
jgi:hypothetical protein